MHTRAAEIWLTRTCFESGVAVVDLGTPREGRMEIEREKKRETTGYEPFD